VWPGQAAGVEFVASGEPEVHLEYQGSMDGVEFRAPQEGRLRRAPADDEVGIERVDEVIQLLPNSHPAQSP